MRDFRRPKLWLGLWIFGWLLCAALSLVPPPDLDVGIGGGDKLGHLLAYFTLSAWAVAIFTRRRDHALAALALLLFGLGMEWSQGELTDYRSMDARDAIANTLGIACGWLVGFTPAREALLRLERRWLAITWQAK